jgi:hypothetical protein
VQGTLLRHIEYNPRIKACGILIGGFRMLLKYPPGALSRTPFRAFAYFAAVFERCTSYSGLDIVKIVRDYCCETSTMFERLSQNELPAVAVATRSVQGLEDLEEQYVYYLFLDDIHAKVEWLSM